MCACVRGVCVRAHVYICVLAFVCVRAGVRVYEYMCFLHACVRVCVNCGAILNTLIYVYA